MNDIGSLLAIVAYATLLVAPLIILVRFLTGGDGVALADMFAVRLDPPWPRGVQEEEPVRWRVERMGEPHRPADRLRGATVRRDTGRSAVGLGVENRRCT